MVAISLPTSPTDTLRLCHDDAVRAYAEAMEDAVRAYASTLEEPCVRAKVVYYRADSTMIDVVDVTPPDCD